MISIEKGKLLNCSIFWNAEVKRIPSLIQIKEDKTGETPNIPDYQDPGKEFIDKTEEGS